MKDEGEEEGEQEEGGEEEAAALHYSFLFLLSQPSL